MNENNGVFCGELTFMDKVCEPGHGFTGIDWVQKYPLSLRHSSDGLDTTIGDYPVAFADIIVIDGYLIRGKGQV